MPFQNPILAGEELVRSAIRSENYTDESEGVPGTGWKISRDGNATFNGIDVRGNASGASAAFDSVIANASLIYQGTELSSLIDRLPRGLLAFGELPAIFYVANAGAYVPLMELDVATEVNRIYNIYTNPFRLTSSANNDHPRVILFYTTDGSQPTPFVGTTTVAEISENVVSVAGRLISSPNMWTAYPQTTRLRVVLVIQSEFGANLTTLDGAIRLYVADGGRFLPFQNTAINRYIPSAAKVFKSFDITPYASRSYRGNGNHMNGTQDQYMYQGDIGVDGNRRSWAWFDGNNTSGGNGLGSIGNMSGIPSGDISYLEIFLYFPHWYNSGGGTCFIGHHNSVTVNLSSEQGGGSYREVTAGWPGRNVGQWVNLRGTALESAILAGAFQGVILGNTLSSTLAHYGYAFGANGVNGQQPGLRAGYYK